MHGILAFEAIELGHRLFCYPVYHFLGNISAVGDVTRIQNSHMHAGENSTEADSRTLSDRRTSIRGIGSELRRWRQQASTVRTSQSCNA
eukprot:SAG31_NODE_2748_length_5147_cov_2.564184_4_plen_89_part_00